MKKPHDYSYEKMLIRCAIAACIVVSFLLYCSGCKIERATQQVMSNEQAFNKVGVKWSKLFPCANDTQFIKSKADTTVKYDTVWTVSKSVTPGFSADGDSYTPPECSPLIDRVSLKSEQKQYPDYGVTSFYGKPGAIITKTVTIHDTDLRYIVDNRHTVIMEDSIRNTEFNLRLSQNESNEWKDKARSRLKWLIIIISSAVTITAFKLFGKNIFAGLKGFITGV